MAKKQNPAAPVSSINQALEKLKKVTDQRQAAFSRKKAAEQKIRDAGKQPGPEAAISPAEALADVLEKTMGALKKAHEMCREGRFSLQQHDKLDRLANQLIGFIEGNSG